MRGLAEKVEVFLNGIANRGLRLVDREPELGHHLPDPRQRLRGTAATDDYEVVGGGDDMGAERHVSAAQTPVLQDPVHVNVGEQKGRSTALRRAARVALSAATCRDAMPQIPDAVANTGGTA